MSNGEIECPKNLHAVLYTDGGARPNPGYIGWGIHGYLYDDKEVVKTNAKHNVPTVKGYCEAFKDEIASGKPVKVAYYLDAWGSGGQGTNQLAELVGFEEALNVVEKYKINKVHFKLDSRYVLDRVQPGGFDSWLNSGWYTQSGKPVSNQENWKSIKGKLDKLIHEGYQFEYSWQEGHVGELGNTKADELATRGVYASQNEYDYSEVLLSSVQGYKTPSPDINTLFTRNRWYFISGENDPHQLKDGRYLYYTGFHGKKRNKKLDEADDDEETFTDFIPPDSIDWGVSQPDTYFGLVATKEKEPLIGNVQKWHNDRYGDTFEQLVIGQLNTILGSKIYDLYLKHGDKLFRRDTHMRRLTAPNDTFVTWEMKPQRLAYLAKDRFDYYRDLLEEYLNGGLIRTDLTDIIYETVINKKKEVHQVRKDIPNNIKFIDTKVNVDVGNGIQQVDLRLTLNIEFPVRAHLARMTEGNTVKPTVILVTWRESSVAYRFGVMIERNGELLFWVGTDCNLRLLK